MISIMLNKYYNIMPQQKLKQITWPVNTWFASFAQKLKKQITFFSVCIILPVLQSESSNFWYKILFKAFRKIWENNI